MSESSGNFVHPPRKKRGRPAKIRRSEDTEISGIETSKSFESLTDESIEFQNAIDNIRRKTPGKINTPKQLKPPPITVFNVLITQVKSDLVSLGVQVHEIKLTRYGTKIFAKFNEQFKIIKSHFLNNKNEFYTHTLRENQTNKFVIHGLYDMDISEITNELVLNEINPCNVKKIQIKKPQRDEQTVFIVYFKKDQQTKISDLRTIRSLHQIRVRWEY